MSNTSAIIVETNLARLPHEYLFADMRVDQAVELCPSRRAAHLCLPLILQPLDIQRSYAHEVRAAGTPRIQAKDRGADQQECHQRVFEVLHGVDQGHTKNSPHLSVRAAPRFNSASGLRAIGYS
ncbi:MAG: hypothetical protein OXT64_03615 [Gammaproteobacteria bacterium]|nr:hypothetical protein [Gammaproteobacteria bacterium]